MCDEQFWNVDSLHNPLRIRLWNKQWFRKWLAENLIEMLLPSLILWSYQGENCLWSCPYIKIKCKEKQLQITAYCPYSPCYSRYTMTCIMNCFSMLWYTQKLLPICLLHKISAFPTFALLTLGYSTQPPDLIMNITLCLCGSETVSHNQCLSFILWKKFLNKKL